ncbi:MAG: T9SS type A sorting domain-containing protein [Cyclobacteriaceae bacterium]|nr:T9SS type A sorting domain-containing protein [Cyclobacteriaceae bacterium]
MDIEVADFNGDGYPDIVLAKEWQRNRILFNDGAGNFTDATIGRFTDVNHDSEDIAIADFDGNGWLDVVFASEDDSTHEFYLNTGSGNFTDVSSRLPQFVSNAVVAVDINGDTYIDLIFGNDGQNRIFINDGTGHFTDETNTRMPLINDVTQDILLVDVDNDGDWDLAVGNEDGNRLLINDGTGVFTDETATRLATTINMESRKVSKADVNGDGYDDLFFSNMASVVGKDIQDRLYLNDGTGHFTDVTNTKLPPDGKHTFDAVFTDFNGDSKPDLTVVYTLNEMPSVLLNDGTGAFIDHTSSYLPIETAGNNIAVYVADFNNDGKDDIYIGRFQQGDGMFFSEMTMSVQQIEKNNAFSIYPNSTKNTLNVNLESDCLSGTVQLTVSDITGKTIIAQNSLNKKQVVLSTETLTSGTYILTLSTPHCKASRKFIIKS